jgi:mono/diheme cytochrome c family protein
MWKETTLVSALVCLGFVSSPKDSKKPDQEKVPTEFRVPPEDASRKNPLTTSPNAIAEGKRRYGFECAACHGKEGDGKGDLVEEMKLKLRDWRDPAALKDFTDGELFYIINKGKGVMTGAEGRANPEQIWQMVIYLRSLAKNQPQAKPKEDKPPL